MNRSKLNPIRCMAQFLLLTVLLALLCAPLAAQQLDCDADFVLTDQSGNTISIQPNGTDDTANIQCALDAAAQLGTPIVRLVAGDFSISSLTVEDFRSTFEGVSRTNASVTVLDGSVDCAAMTAAGRESAAIKFIRGEPRIRFMNIQVNDPCADGSELGAVISFTGGAAGASCDNDVIFGNVDRLDIVGPGATGVVNTGIGVYPEGWIFGECNQTLLGTFKMNRGTIQGVQLGLVTNLRASAQVDVKFNEMTDVGVGIFFIDANQDATVAFNTVNTVDGFGIATYTQDANAPTINRMVLNRNTIEVSSLTQASAGIAYIQEGRVANIETVVSSNEIVASGDMTVGIFGSDVSTAHVSGNTFFGSGDNGLTVDAEMADFAQDWTIVANRFANFEAQSGFDIVLGGATRRCIVGPAQGAMVFDGGVDNTLLGLGGPTASAKSRSVGSAPADWRAALQQHRTSKRQTSGD